MENSVNDLLNIPFSSRNYSDKLTILKLGKPKPALDITSKHKDKNCEYIRHFSASNYESIEWLTGCEVRQKLFCFICMLFSTENGVWNKNGYNDLNHLTVAVQRHEKSRAHMQAYLAFKMFGKQRIDTLLDCQKRAGISRHNEEVKKIEKFWKD